MKRRIPARYAPILFALLLSCFMSFVVTCIATERLTGIGPGFTHAWLKSWIPAWLVAFPTAFLAAPLVRKIVAQLVVDNPRKMMLRQIAPPSNHQWRINHRWRKSSAIAEFGRDTDVSKIAFRQGTGLYR